MQVAVSATRHTLSKHCGRQHANTQTNRCQQELHNDIMGQAIAAEKIQLYYYTCSLIILSKETPIMAIPPKTHLNTGVFKGMTINIIILVLSWIIWLILTTEKHLL